MQGNGMRFCTIMLLVLGGSVFASKPAPEHRSTREVRDKGAVATSDASDRVADAPTDRSNAFASAMPAGPSIARSMEERITARVSSIRTHGSASVAGGPTGFAVYRNESLTPTLYRPGAETLIADDLELAGGAATMLQYSVVVLGTGQSGEPTFTVHTELWDGNPCEDGSVVIAGTARDFVDVPNDQSLVELNAFFDESPIEIPGTVYLAVTFGPAPAGNDAGWIVAGRSELGRTENSWSEPDSDPACSGFFFGCGSSYAGFWASIIADVDASESGACCDGASCAEVLEADCTTGIWQGPFTNCSPSPCAAGACCSGGAFGSCTETTQAGCLGGLFYFGGSCDSTPCGDVFSDYANTFDIDGFHRVEPNVLRADDVKRLTNAPCELGGYEVLVIGNGNLGPPFFNATVELWSNLEGEIGTDLDDVPDAPIPGTVYPFENIPSDLCPQRLVVGSFAGQGIMLPKEFWVAVTTDTGFAGPMLSGPAKVGGSIDGFAEFNTLVPGAWQGGFWFGGFDGTGCPSAVTCNPAGSYRIVVWCAGDRLTGACCDDRRGTCIDGVVDVDCDGRWAVGETCALNSLDPPCANNACCAPNPLNPNVLSCINTTREVCESLQPPGAFSPGQFCENISCPSRTCYDATGDCFTGRQTRGCEDAFCCEAVCAIDDFCCNTRWDGTCADTAQEVCRAPTNDEPDAAEPVVAQGAVDFDNGTATSSGPNNAACATLGDLDGFNNDLWYCWTAPCTDLITLETCGLTQVDTKLAVYEGCEGPPSDQNLVACNDDACGFQSRVSFVANTGDEFLIRVGSFSAAGTGGDDFPLLPVGPGSFSIGCSGASHEACMNGNGDGDCCDPTGTGTPACNNELCCNLVCACDPFCCDDTWDEFCATTGFENSGCGAALLCTACVPSCPTGTMMWVDPPDGVVDARLSMDPSTSEPLGIETVVAEGPPGAGADCFTPCDASAAAGSLSIVDVFETPVVEGVLASYEIMLSRPLTPFAVTTITYTDETMATSTGTFTTHPGNVNGDGTAAATDITALINVLNGGVAGVDAPWGGFSTDIDHSGVTNPPDIIAAIDALNGAGPLTPSANTSKPDGTGICP